MLYEIAKEATPQILGMLVHPAFQVANLLFLGYVKIDPDECGEDSELKDSLSPKEAVGK